MSNENYRNKMKVYSKIFEEIAPEKISVLVYEILKTNPKDMEQVLSVLKDANYSLTSVIKFLRSNNDEMYKYIKSSLVKYRQIDPLSLDEKAEMAFELFTKKNMTIDDFNHYAIIVGYTKAVFKYNARRHAAEIDSNLVEEIYDKFKEYRAEELVLNYKDIKSYKKVYDIVIKNEYDFNKSAAEIGCCERTIESYLGKYLDFYATDEEKEIWKQTKCNYQERLKSKKTNSKKEKQERNKRQSAKNLSTYKIIVEELLNYKSQEHFLKETFIDREELKYALRVVKDYLPKLYNQYQDLVKVRKQKLYLSILKNIDKIVNLIVNGVEENGELREFNIYDYQKITSLDLEDFTEFYKKQKRNISERQKVVSFLEKNKILGPDKMDEILSADRQFYIDGNIIKVSEEDKDIVFNEVNNNINDWTVTEKVFSLALREYAFNKYGNKENKTKSK